MTSPNPHASLSPEIDAAITAAIKEGFDRISNELNKVTEKLFSNYEQQRRDIGDMRNALADVFMTTALNLRTSSLPPPLPQPIQPQPQQQQIQPQPQQQQIQPQPPQQQQQIASRPPEHPFIPFTVNTTPNRGTRNEQLIAPMISSNTPPFLANQIDRESSSSPVTLSHPERPIPTTVETSPTANNNLQLAVTSSGSNSNNNQPIPTYTMSRKLKSVVDVWKEYDQGISGQTPVRFLEDTFGTKWRKDRSLSRFFSRRNVFYREIKRMAQEENIPELTAAIQLERKRCHLKVSLDKFSKMISTERGH